MFIRCYIFITLCFLYSWELLENKCHLVGSIPDWSHLIPFRWMLWSSLQVNLHILFRWFGIFFSSTIYMLPFCLSYNQPHKNKSKRCRITHTVLTMMSHGENTNLYLTRGLIQVAFWYLSLFFPWHGLLNFLAKKIPSFY